MGVDLEITMSDTINFQSETRPRATHGTSVDDLFEVLSEGRRRTILTVLTERRSSMEVERLAHAVAAREDATGSGTPSESTVERVHLTLHHVHLPKLDEAALVDYDREAGSVVATDAADGVPIDVE